MNLWLDDLNVIIFASNLLNYSSKSYHSAVSFHRVVRSFPHVIHIGPYFVSHTIKIAQDAQCFHKCTAKQYICPPQLIKSATDDGHW